MRIKSCEYAYWVLRTRTAYAYAYTRGLGKGQKKKEKEEKKKKGHVCWALTAMKLGK